jgi:orotate phosphoribosyltransferase
MNLAQDFIRFALNTGVIKLGTFTTKSGRVSPYFFNLGEIYDGLHLDLLGQMYAQTLVNHSIECDILFGPAYKGISLINTTSIILQRDHGINSQTAFTRKEIKNHGEGGAWVGANPQGKNVLILDDVLTSGISAQKSIQDIENSGGTVCGILIGFDRQEKGVDDHLSARQTFEHMGIPTYSIATLSDLKDFLYETQEYLPHLQQILSYEQQYGHQKNLHDHKSIGKMVDLSSQ